MNPQIKEIEDLLASLKLEYKYNNQRTAEVITRKIIAKAEKLLSLAICMK